jgi:preprotein translocase subunit YajC
MIAPSLTFLAQTTQQPAAPSAGGMLIPMIAIFAIMYFLIIRPQSKRQKELAARVSNLKTGDKVITSGGIHGIVSNVKEGTTLSLKIADNVKIEVDKTAIASVEKDAVADKA